MEVIKLPNGTMFSDEFEYYIKKLKIPNFIGVFMRNEIPSSLKVKECAVLNLEDNSKEGSHWVTWMKNEDIAFYFDSYGEPPDTTLRLHLNGLNIKRSAITVQHDSSKECGALCLYVLYFLSKEVNFGDILYTLQKRYRETKQQPLTINTRLT